MYASQVELDAESKKLGVFTVTPDRGSVAPGQTIEVSHYPRV